MAEWDGLWGLGLWWREKTEGLSNPGSCQGCVIISLCTIECIFLKLATAYVFDKNIHCLKIQISIRRDKEIRKQCM